MIRIFMISVVASFLTTSLVKAQNATGDLLLTVFKESGKPLSKATVSILKDGQIWVVQRSTSSNGTISIYGLDSGSHTILVRYGSRNLKTEFIVKPGRNELNLVMKRERLPLLALEVQPALISDLYGGRVSTRKIISINHGPQIRKSHSLYWNSPMVGGLWLPDTRAPTFRNMMNVQPND